LIDRLIGSYLELEPLLRTLHGHNVICGKVQFRNMQLSLWTRSCDLWVGWVSIYRCRREAAAVNAIGRPHTNKPTVRTYGAHDFVSLNINTAEHRLIICLGVAVSVWSSAIELLCFQL